ncbi:CO dehydrogenase/acetyl-CoA synthase subunit delta [Methanocella arvoryzae]|uniref:Acetyl-CoA decarbonylase/synthase complex subunit delta n=1 Tax=Methanocella arvoryzae (strain DSM 22066 / NBRC 105507 / MRE50) TaxID=351160 RepID=Q0W880_METAR|nr:CO dehydrogenase/acetyl-CoA synthase subunit delta [Methanocella arvoryzae]CAJ35413.1 carbon monoxide dehydrogenase/acetyl-CoA synthase complex, corrinoid small subunit [Methanocella arvoryzae MRE50]
MAGKDNRLTGGGKMRDNMPDILSLMAGVDRIELENFTMEIGDLELWIPARRAMSRAMPQAVQPVASQIMQEKPSALFSETYVPPVENFPCSIREVRLGATRKDGGSRRRTFTLGGSGSPPFVYADRPPANLPVFAMDVFDMSIPMPAAVKADIRDVMDDPAEWARRNVEQFGADMVTVHLVSTDPLGKDSSPAEAARTVEDVLQAVDVPLIIGGCGDPQKDAEVFAKVSEAASGERLLLNSVTLDMAAAGVLETITGAAKAHGHAVIGLTGLELNKAKELNRRLFDYLPPEDIVMDLTTVALGYGLEYSFSIHERARQAALLGDDELQQPTISAASNAWVAREARTKMDPVYGPREFRGPLWETLNALTLVLAGVDIFMVAHPATLKTLKEIIQMLIRKETVPSPEANMCWSTARI